MHAAALQLNSNIRGRVGACERLGIVEKSRAGIEVTAQPLHSRELGQHLRPSLFRSLALELFERALEVRKLDPDNQDAIAFAEEAVQTARQALGT